MRVCTSAILACLFPRCVESGGIVKNAQATAEKAVTTGTDYGAVKGAGAPNDNFRKNICSEDDLRSRIFGTLVVKFLA